MSDVRIPEILKALRQVRGLTQEALAREIGVTFATVNTWENGHRTPMPFLACRIVELAEQAGLDVGEFQADGTEETDD